VDVSLVLIFVFGLLSHRFPQRSFYVFEVAIHCFASDFLGVFSDEQLELLRSLDLFPEESVL
jgi:hypothetical protein